MRPPPTCWLRFAEMVLVQIKVAVVHKSNECDARIFAPYLSRTTHIPEALEEI